MAKYWEDLPPDVALRFPAYALGDQFVGYRWLAGWGWDTRGWLSSVGLGHGGPMRKSGFVVVYTFVKSRHDRFTPPMYEVDLPGPRARHGAGPTGYRDALFRAAMTLVEPSPHEASDPAADRGRIIAEVVNEADWENPQDESMHRPGRLRDPWVPTTVTIDGEDHSADTRHLNQRWATIVDLPTVAVTIAGPDAMFDLATSLTDARNSVREYK